MTQDWKRPNFVLFSLSPKKYSKGKFCLNCFNLSSICQRFLYILAILSAGNSKVDIPGANQSLTPVL